MKCLCNINYINTNNEESNLFEDDNENFFSYLLDNINYKIFKCYKLVFIFENLKNNYSFYMILSVSFLILVIDFTFFFYSVQKLKIMSLKDVFIKKVKIKNPIKKKQFKKNEKKTINKKGNKILIIGSKKQKLSDDSIILSSQKTIIKKEKNILKNKRIIKTNASTNNCTNFKNKFKIFKNKNKHKLFDKRKEVIRKVEGIKKNEDINELPYTQAIVKDKEML